MAIDPDNPTDNESDVGTLPHISGMGGGSDFGLVSPDPNRWEGVEVTPDKNAASSSNGKQVYASRWEGPSVGALSADREQRIMQLMQAARAVHPDNPVLAQIAVAQAITESGWDINSGLARNYNNLFGIKGTGTAGSVDLSTHEFYGHDVVINAGFAHNATIEDSFLQHASLLNRLDLYRPVVTATTFSAAANGLVSAGYATDPNYADKLISVNNKLQTLWTKVNADQPNSTATADVKTPAAIIAAGLDGLSRLATRFMPGNLNQLKVTTAQTPGHEDGKEAPAANSTAPGINSAGSKAPSKAPQLVVPS